MKTIEELYNEINASEELKKAASAIKDKGALADFLKEHGCDASADEFEKFVKSQTEGEIGDDAAGAAAGGGPMFGFRAPEGASREGSGFVDCIKAFFS